jgi:ABC-type uncharacterized transport system permease subunit
MSVELIALGGISSIGLGLIAVTYAIPRITNTLATALADAIMTDATALMVERLTMMLSQREKQ